MKFPLVARSSVRHLEIQVDLVTADRDYWKKRAEQLIDAALARAGAIHQPTMEQRVPSKDIASVASMIAGSLAIKEIDSSIRKVAS